MIRRFEVKTGTISTFAGNGKRSVGRWRSRREPASASPSAPVQPDGDLYIVDISSHVVRRVDGRTRHLDPCRDAKAGLTPDGAPIAGPAERPAIDGFRHRRPALAPREGTFPRPQSGVIRHVTAWAVGFTGDDCLPGRPPPARTLLRRAEMRLTLPIQKTTPSAD